MGRQQVGQPDVQTQMTPCLLHQACLADPKVPGLLAQGTARVVKAAAATAGAARLGRQKAQYTAWSLQLMRSGSRSHGTAATPDPLLAARNNAEIESLAAHLASLR